MSTATTRDAIGPYAARGETTPLAMMMRFAVGSIPIVPYARPGTVDLGLALLPYLPHSRVMILARHGALCWGESLEEAYMGVERLEHAAKTMMYAQMLGGLSELPDEEVAFLRGQRALTGERIL